MSEFEVRDYVELSSIPYPTEFRSVMAMGLLLKNANVQATHSISPRQVEQLTQARQKFKDNVSRPSKDPLANFGKFQEESRKDVERILSNAQLLSISRRYALEEFNANFRTPFERDDFLSYLKITKPTDIAAIRAITTSDWNAFQSEEKKLNVRTFGEICSTLPADAQRRLELLFDGVWK